MPVTFQDHRLSDQQPPLTLEESFRLYAAYAGIHDCNFDDLFTDSSISYTGTVAATWTSALQIADLPLSYTVSYTKTVARQGVVVGVGSTGTGYLVCTDSSGIYVYYGATLKYSVPIVTPTEADVVVAFRQVRYNDREDELWRVITLWMNDALILTYSEPASLIIDSPRFGMAAYGTDAVTYTDVRVPELTDFAEWATLDPGETPLGGLRRVIEGRYLQYFVRFNGELRAWRPKSRVEDHELVDNVIYTGRVSTDLSQMANHIRMVGAYTWAEALDADLVEKYEHRFREENNPMLMSEKECYTEAVRSLKRVREAANGEQVRTPFTPLLEPEDRVSTPNGDWLISQMDQSLVLGGVNQTLTLKQYVWD